MGRLIDFLLANPILLLVVGVWIAGMIGNIVRVAQKARERAEQRTGMPPADERRAARGVEPPVREPRSSEDIAREMRRILGGERDEAEERSAEEPPRPAAPPPPPRPRPRPVAAPVPMPPPLPRQVARRDAVEPERAPVPVVPTTATRRLEIHVDPHVGGAIAQRGAPASGKVGEHAQDLGRLGGRVHHAGPRRKRASRYALDDLKRVVVMNEILGPPLALRRPDERER